MGNLSTAPCPIRFLALLKGDVCFLTHVHVRDLRQAALNASTFATILKGSKQCLILLSVQDEYHVASQALRSCWFCKRDL